jgi:hypothetical protein
MTGDEQEQDAQAPTGLPEGAQEKAPLGPTHAEPDGESERKSGAEQMPGIPTDGEPETSG